MAGRTLEIGVVIAGAGSRGAYEAGLLSFLLPEIAARTQAEGRVARFWFVGTSAGSLNSVLIASRAPRVMPDQDPEEVRELWMATMDEVANVWGSVSEGRVIGLLPNGRLLAALTRLMPAGRLPLTSLLNTDPLHRLAEDPSIVDWEQLRRNVADGTGGAVGAATAARDGRTVLFLQRQAGEPIPRDVSRDIDYVDCPSGLEAQHVLASSAIPLAFPPQRISEPPEWEGWYYDGGVRLNTPLKPAIQLGLRHLVIVGTHPDRSTVTNCPTQSCTALRWTRRRFPWPTRSWPTAVQEPPDRGGQPAQPRHVHTVGRPEAVDHPHLRALAVRIPHVVRQLHVVGPGAVPARLARCHPHVHGTKPAAQPNNTWWDTPHLCI
jgi:NTE family protein